MRTGASWIVLNLAFVLGACGSVDTQVHPGLANAPGLGGSRADVRVHDDVANGNDSCERHGVGGSPLRGHLPPCPGGETTPQPVKIVYRSSSSPDDTH